MRASCTILLTIGLFTGCAQRCQSEQPPSTDGKAASGAKSATGGDALADDPAPAAVVLIVVDALRADFLPFYGHTPNTAPFLDAMLRDAVVFENAYATSSWTVPSVASLHTGVYPTSHGIVSSGFMQAKKKKGRRTFTQPVLQPAFTTLAETLRGAGYTTVGVPSNQLLAAQFGFAQGFDSFEKEAYFQDARQLNRIIERHLTETFGGERPDRWLTSKTFLWVHYFDPHEPYKPRIPWSRVFAPGYWEHPERYPANMVKQRIKKKFKADEAFRELATPLYESEIAFWDDQFNRLAKKMGLIADDVLFIFTADHGEEFAEHGGMGHSEGLHEEVVHVPLAMRWPRGFSGPRRVSTPVSLIDVFPTVVELTGVHGPPGLQGRSLVPLLRGAAGDAERPILMELHPPNPEMKALRRGRYKIIRAVSKGAPGGFSTALYDLSVDPGEHVDISQAKPEIVKQLVLDLDETVHALPPPPAGKERSVDDEQLLEQLINMDYVRADAP
jgi:arylsulfatase A-like enzyme